MALYATTLHFAHILSEVIPNCNVFLEQFEKINPGFRRRRRKNRIFEHMFYFYGYNR